jgi:hypothetical protein
MIQEKIPFLLSLGPPIVLFEAPPLAIMSIGSP